MPELSATNIVTWNFHVDDFSKGRYNFLLGRGLLTAFGFNIKFYENVVKADGGLLKGSLSPIFYLSVWEFIHLKTGIITPK